MKSEFQRKGAKPQRRKGKPVVAGLASGSLFGERFASFRFRLEALRLCAFALNNVALNGILPA